MRNVAVIVLLLGLAAAPWAARAGAVPDGQVTHPPAGEESFSGSVSCRACHERFYQLWASSHHGLAMQPYTAALAAARLTPQHQAVRIGKHRYRAEIGPDQGWVVELGPEGEKKYTIAHVMGGKNVYFFLTPLQRGRLQTLPLAYDVQTRRWYDTAASGVRHSPSGPALDPLHWTDSAYTFNTSCYHCHVSQLATNYDLQADSYHTVWAEPGINCESCHGPAAEHARVCRAAPEGQAPADLAITTVTVSRGFTSHQANSSCAPCHAKMHALTTSFEPGERYFDHYDLVTLEHPDFYPDGRDLGENYTYTSWRMSPCVRSGKLDCMHCHTSSGRYRHADDPNQSCLPCHQARVDNAVKHHRHDQGGRGSRCVDCHMPTTRFAAMSRSDHSMLPPTPAATLAFESPNACNICHDDKDAAWADGQVRAWHAEDYQAAVLHRAGLVAAARQGQWQRLPEMLAYLNSAGRDEVSSSSLIRLLVSCGDERKYPALLQALKDPFPLVRAAAADGLAGYFTAPGVQALLRATTDEYRVVRIRAAQALAGFPPESLPPEERPQLQRATGELLTSLTCRPDDWSSHYNLGNLFMVQGRLERAVAAFQMAIRLRADAVLPAVNVSMAYARLGRDSEAEHSLRQALKHAPDNAAANFNLGLLLAEKGRGPEAERCLRTALKTDPGLARAAYNLGLLLVHDRLEEAVGWLHRAHQLQPRDPEYAYSLAFYLLRKGDSEAAVRTLQMMVDAEMNAPDAYLLLIDTLSRQGRREEARVVIRRALANQNLPAAFRQRVQALSRGGE